MKKLLLIILLFLCCNTVEAREKVTLNKCVDGDTAWFNLNNETIKVRFLAINTPESTNKKEHYGKEASEYTCNLLSKAKIIELEYDENSDLKDKYDRTLAWVFVDDELLQDLIIKKGLGKVDYLYGDYKYTSILQVSEIKAKESKLGIWQDTNIFIYILVIILLIICFIFNKQFRNKVIKKTNKKLKKTLTNI